MQVLAFVNQRLREFNSIQAMKEVLCYDAPSFVVVSNSEYYFINCQWSCQKSGDEEKPVMVTSPKGEIKKRKFEPEHLAKIASFNSWEEYDYNRLWEKMSKMIDDECEMFEQIKELKKTVKFLVSKFGGRHL